MPSGGARPGAGRPLGSGDPWKKALREEHEAAREARRKLIEKYSGTAADPFVVLMRIAADANEPSGVRAAAAGKLIGYWHSATPEQVQHTHTIDADTLRQQFIDKMNALASAARPVIDAAPEPLPAPLPEPEPVALAPARA